MAKTNKQLDALQLEIDALRQKKAEIDAALAEAQGRFFAAENEINKNEKPTPAMLNVLSIVVAGGVIRKGRWDSSYHLWDADGEYYSLRDSVFYGLRSRQAIVEGDRVDGAPSFAITEHGRAILAKYSTHRRNAG